MHRGCLVIEIILEISNQTNNSNHDRDDVYYSCDTHTYTSMNTCMLCEKQFII